MQVNFEMNARKAHEKMLEEKIAKVIENAKQQQNGHCLGLPYWYHQLVLSWYLHQPASHLLSFHKVCLFFGILRSNGKLTLAACAVL